MIRSILFLAITAFAFGAIDASAAEVKVAYKGIVTQANGAQASSFAPGQTVTLYYLVESTTSDNNPDPSKGVFFNGLRQLSISIPAAGIDVTTGIGTVQTFNNVGSDQAFFYGTATTGGLAGLPVAHTEVDFVDDQSMMLGSDAIPTTHLTAAESFVSFGTSAGYTYVHFLAEPEEPVTSCASEGYTGMKLYYCTKVCESGYSGALLEMWLRRWNDRYRPELPYCARND
jgi:hypothetical protein